MAQHFRDLLLSHSVNSVTVCPGSHCCGMGLIPGLGILHAVSVAEKKRGKKKRKKERKSQGRSKRNQGISALFPYGFVISLLEMTKAITYLCSPRDNCLSLNHHNTLP